MTGTGPNPREHDDPGVRAVALAALELVGDGACVGLGSGRTAAAFIVQLGARVRLGLHANAVAASGSAARLAREAGVPLIDLDEDLELDLTVDGADEVAPNLDLIKGMGGALVRERIVASASRRQVIVVASGKLVRALGDRHPIPVEVVPFGLGLVTRELKALGLAPVVRMDATQSARLISENGNLTLDCAVMEPLADGAAARALEGAVRSIPGVVDTGLFLGTAERVLVGYPDDHVETILRGGC
ncbi:MAG TPA: ribose-5-phosphate isomerase RpiA [Gemmatimonadaceae bacterium]|nr:ribose-5-phosphate isomerase RpiA [Gemmatimonadaceae bacterium]